jgi:hypothetical protein
MLRAIRTFGPEYVADRFSENVACDGYCSTCARLSTDPGLEDRLAPVLETPAAHAMESLVTTLQQEGGAVAFARRAGVAKYAELVALGAPEGSEQPRVA